MPERGYYRSALAARVDTPLDKPTRMVYNGAMNRQKDHLGNPGHNSARGFWHPGPRRACGLCIMERKRKEQGHHLSGGEHRWPGEWP